MKTGSSGKDINEGVYSNFYEKYQKKPSFANGEEVEVKWYQISDWVPGTFIGMNGGSYVVKEIDGGICTYPYCRKLNAIEKEFNAKIDALNDLYESGKDCLQSLPVTEKDSYWRLFEILKQLRDLAIENIQLLNNKT